MLGTLVLAILFAVPKIQLTANSDYGIHRLELVKMVTELRPLLEQVAENLPPAADYAIQVLAIDRDGGVYITVLRRENREISFPIPINQTTPQEAARDTAKNVGIAIRCDIAGKGLTACHRGGDGD